MVLAHGPAVAEVVGPAVKYAEGLVTGVQKLETLVFFAIFFLESQISFYTLRS